MPFSSYKAAKDSAFRERPALGKVKILCSVDHKTGTNDIAQIVLTEILCSVDHKTGTNDIAQIVFTEYQFELLRKYVKYVRPFPNQTMKFIFS